MVIVEASLVCGVCAQVLDKGLKTMSDAWQSEVESDITPIEVGAVNPVCCLQWYGPQMCQFDIDMEQRPKVEAFASCLLSAIESQGDDWRLITSRSYHTDG